MRAILLALLVSTGAHALTRDDITRDSECGAPGIGEIWAGEKRGQIEQRDGAPGVRVNAEGFWEIGCKPALQPAGPAGCPGGGAVSWAVGSSTCTSEIGSVNPGSPSKRQPLPHGSAQLLQQFVGSHRGYVLEVCNDGKRTQTISICAPVSHCTGPWSYARNGRSYRFSGSIPVGSAGKATSADGSSIRVVCDGGNLRAAPQCVAGQEVVRIKTWERTTYRYSGPPVDGGVLVSAEEVRRVDTRSNTALPVRGRSTVATCFDGVLQ